MKASRIELQVQRQQVLANLQGTKLIKCPICRDIQLVITERQGVEIDCCPQCRGIWLDRGELDKILERSMSVAAELPGPGSTRAGLDARERGHDKLHSGHDGHHRRGRSWLRELFE